MSAVASAGAASHAPVHRGPITVSVMLATIMQALDTTIANVALPHMQGSLSATQDQISWVLTSYIIAAAIMTPPTGFLALRFGRRRVFAWAVGGFTVVSTLCGIATSLPEMVFYRLLQGVFGASLVPLSQSVLLDTFPRERHGSAMAMWGMGVMLGPILGPTLGGYLTEYYNWRWVFYINVPICAVALLGVWKTVPQTRLDRSRPFDVFGFTMLSIAIGAFQFMLDRGELKDWFSSTEIVVEAGIAALADAMPPCGELVLTNNGIGDEGLVKLGKSKRLAGLTTLFVTDNDLTDEGVAAFAKSTVMTALTRLGLARNWDLSTEGLSAIARSKKLKRLRWLEYSDPDESCQRVVVRGR